jgi:NAD(P)-dependent dehydrogenase (short-subunit alcohol dehydrogenase family)
MGDRTRQGMGFAAVGMLVASGARVAQNRVGEPHEAGELIAFLLSPAAAFMTGALLNIDGGTNF